jgi:hypothetical protein
MTYSWMRSGCEVIEVASTSVFRAKGKNEQRYDTVWGSTSPDHKLGRQQASRMGRYTEGDGYPLSYLLPTIVNS